MIAYMLIHMPMRCCDDIAQKLRNIDEIREVAGLYGETDLFVKIEAENTKQLDRVMLDIIRQHKEIENTHTYIAMSEIYWRKDG